MKLSIYKTTVFLLASLLIFTVGYAQNKSVSQLVKAELQEVNSATNLVVFNSTRYKYQVDLKNAKYKYEDAEKLIEIKDLIKGETYYFNLYQSEPSRSDQFKLIFIAQEPQAE